jgi:ATP-dependent DNA ligase
MSAIRLLQAGLVAAVIISTSTAYAFGEVTGRSHSLNSSLREGWPFYAMLVAAAGIGAQIKFTEWTSDNQLRQPVFLGLRTDKPG